MEKALQYVLRSRNVVFVESSSNTHSGCPEAEIGRSQLTKSLWRFLRPRPSKTQALVKSYLFRPGFANNPKPSNHIAKKIPLRKATSQPGFQLSPFVEMFFERIPGVLIIFIPWHLYPRNILMWYTWGCPACVPFSDIVIVK